MSSGDATVLGTGLLGASIGLALRKQGWSVSGWDPDTYALRLAAERGAVEHTLRSSDVGDADLVILAAPPEAVVNEVGSMSTRALVSDICSVKTPIVSAAAHLDHFVGGHPMAGGETTGAAMSSSSMFHGARWVLTNDGADEKDLGTMAAVVASIGANPVIMTAAEHDASVARVSHLPHLLAAALMGLAETDPATLGLAGGGFRDLTRIAAGDSAWWAEVLAANAEQVGASIDELTQTLEDWKRVLAVGGRSDLTALLEAARQARLGLGEHNVQVRVILLDQPGEIARVGHALERSRVDVRDFQLRHGEHGGGGVLTISVRGDGQDALVMALADEGFETRV